MCICLKKSFLSVGWIADGVWMGQQQREGAEIVVSREASRLQGFSSIGLTARLARPAPASPSPCGAAQDLAGGRKEKPGG